MKGVLYTVESVIAILMILFIVVFLFQRPQPSPEYQIINYKLNTYNGLKILDEMDNLRDYVMNRDVNLIENGLNPYVPDSLNYTVVIFNETTNTTEKPSLTDRDVISVSYFLAGDLDNYNPREVRVYLWGLE